MKHRVRAGVRDDPREENACLRTRRWRREDEGRGHGGSLRDRRFARDVVSFLTAEYPVPA
jgi:hypothetical protein